MVVLNVMFLEKRLEKKTRNKVENQSEMKKIDIDLIYKQKMNVIIYEHVFIYI